MVNKKVLITIGCSFTEGVGCWDYNLLPKNKHIDELSTSENFEFHQNNLDNFLKGSWGTQLQKKIGYHTHINCGIGASSNSHQLKNFMDTIHTWNIDNSDVLVIWMMTYNHRFSFYNRDLVTTYGIAKVDDNNNVLDSNDELTKSHIIELGDSFDISMAKESFHNLRCMRDICRVNNFNFLFTSVEHNDDFRYLIDNFLDIDTLTKRLEYNHNGLSEYNMMARTWKHTSHCGHQNEIGYGMISDNIFNSILKNHSYLINTEEVSEYVQIRNPKKYDILAENKRLK